MGAPNNSNCKSCDTTSATYSKQINPLLAAWCTGCHNQGSAGGGFDLTNYSGVVTAIQNNKLLGSIKHLKGFIPMPQNSSALSACDIGTVQKWINEGYPNN